MNASQISRRELLEGVLTSTGALIPAAGTSFAVPTVSSQEWTFEKARAVWKPMTRAVQHVGVPGHEWQAGVMWDGALFFGPPEKGVRNFAAMADEIRAVLGNNALHVSVAYGNPMSFADRRATAAGPVKRGLLEGRLPIPYVETKDGELTWQEAVFARMLGRSLGEAMDPKREDVLVVHARFTVRNSSAGANDGHLWLHFGDTNKMSLGYKAGESDELGQALRHHYEAPYGLLDDKVRYVIPTPAKGKIVWHEAVSPVAGIKGPAERVLEWQVHLHAHEEAFIDLIVPYKAIDKTLAASLVTSDHEKLFAGVRDFWKEIENGPGAMTTPDPFVNDYLAAVPGQMAQQVAYRHEAGVWMYKTSPNHYEMYWPCNAAKALPAFDLRGLTRFSRPVLKSFIDTQSDDYGALTRQRHGKEVNVAGEGYARVPGFLGNYGKWTANTLLLSHGLELWALAAHYRIGRDRQWLGEGPGSPLQAILLACDWTAAQRRCTMREENGRKVAHWGLLPAAAAHDWLSGNTIFNDAFCIFGMIEAVHLLREIQHPRAEEIAHELNEYRACLRDRYREARDRARPLPLPGSGTLPYVPRDVYELDWAKIDWTYTGYGPLRAGAWGAFDPHDELVDQALRFLESGLPKGEGFYFKIAKDPFNEPTADENFRDVSDSNADRHFLWKHYVEYETMWPIGGDFFLQRDDLPRFFEWLFNNLSIVLHHDYRVGVESLDGVPSCAPGEGERWRAIRNMFVNERGGYDGSQQSLWLLQALPGSWLKPAYRLAVQQMGTHFGGAVDLEVKTAKDGKSVQVNARLDLVIAPAEMRMRLRSGDGRPLLSASINGKPTPVLEKDTIKLPNVLKADYRIVGRFQ